MEKTYTKKQITEAIAYWEKQLKKMDESFELNEVTQIEHSVAQNIKRLFEQQYKGRFSADQIQILNKPYYGPKSISKAEASIPIKIYCSGTKGTSDIYIVLQNGNDIKQIGIEVKSTGSMFNPQLNYSLGSIGYENSQFHDLFSTSAADAITQQCQNEYGKFVQKMLSGAQSQLKKNLDIVLSTPLFKKNNITSFPALLESSKKAKFLKTLMKQLNGIYPEDLLSASRFLKRLLLAEDIVHDNSLVKAYFNSLRQYPESSYQPVQYIQYDGNLYCIDSNCDFFVPNATSSYNVSSYDNAFTGVKIRWFIDFSNKSSDNVLRIRGYVKAFTRDDASLDDTRRLPAVNDEGIFN